VTDKAPAVVIALKTEHFEADFTCPRIEQEEPSLAIALTLMHEPKLLESNNDTELPLLTKERTEMDEPISTLDITLNLPVTCILPAHDSCWLSSMPNLEKDLIEILLPKLH
jgi:hypothetical protein